jgi:hypothetical protein
MRIKQQDPSMDCSPWFISSTVLRGSITASSPGFFLHEDFPWEVLLTGEPGNGLLAQVLFDWEYQYPHK